MTYLNLIVELQHKLEKANFNPTIAYDLILHENPSIHSKEELIDFRNEEAENVSLIMADLRCLIEDHLPLSRLTHQTNFYGYHFEVADGVFAPRPETELLVEAVSNWINDQQKTETKIIDLGTGSGVIPISLKKQFQNEVDCTGIDINPKAIQLASRNASINKVKITFIRDDFVHYLETTSDHQFDIIVSNPPYIDQNDPEVEESAKKYDPSEALFAPENGLYYYYQIIKLSILKLADNSLIAFEIGHRQATSIQQFILDIHYPFKMTTLKDYYNLDRVILLEKRKNVF